MGKGKKVFMAKIVVQVGDLVSFITASGTQAGIVNGQRPSDLWFEVCPCFGKTCVYIPSSKLTVEQSNFKKKTSA
jgi:hypothetical protein